MCLLAFNINDNLWKTSCGMIEPRNTLLFHCIAIHTHTLFHILSYMIFLAFSFTDVSELDQSSLAKTFVDNSNGSLHRTI